jgi:hypothetical protein
MWRHSVATNRKVAGSIPEQIIDFLTCLIIPTAIGHVVPLSSEQSAAGAATCEPIA